jgi:hypothetical protein
MVSVLIRQSVQHGSVFAALSAKAFTSHVLLEWLGSTADPVTSSMLVAYKAVCSAIPPCDQYLRDGVHILSKRPEYVCVAVGFGLRMDRMATKTCETPLIHYVRDEMEKILRDVEYQHLIATIIDGTRLKDGTDAEKDKVLSYAARNESTSKRYNSKENNLYLQSDWIEKLVHVESLVEHMKKRIDFLKKEAPLYYTAVVHKSYRTLFKELVEKKLIGKASRETLVELDSYFPDILDENLFKYSPLAYTISQMPKEIEAYILGFPIDTMFPSEEQMIQGLLLLSNLGETEYAQKIRSLHAQSQMVCSPLGTHFMTKSSNKANDTDVLLEQIEDYYPYDVISYYRGDHVYRFVRTEFKQIIDTGKNPWTNELLPNSIIAAIKARIKAQNTINLPMCNTVADTFASIARGEYMVEKEQHSVSNTSDVLALLAASIMLAGNS